MAVSLNTENRESVELRWDVGDHEGEVQVFAQGKGGEWHNTAAVPNDGLAGLSYPADFSGTSYVEVRDLEGNVLDSGEIAVGESVAAEEEKEEVEAEEAAGEEEDSA